MMKKLLILISAALLSLFSCTKEGWGGYHPAAEFMFVEKVADICIFRPVAMIGYLDTLYSDTSLTFKDGSSFILNYSNGDRIGPLTMSISAGRDTVWTYCDESYIVARNEDQWSVRRNEKQPYTVFTYDYALNAEPVDENGDGIRDGWKIVLDGRRLEDGSYYMTYSTMDDFIVYPDPGAHYSEAVMEGNLRIDFWHRDQFKDYISVSYTKSGTQSYETSF
ncbi:MAG: hypothetical protein ACI3Z0_08755 [Candidatus Cryptobacteroides sp.]